MEKMRFEKDTEVVFLTESAMYDKYLIAHKSRILGKNLSKLELPEGATNVGPRWRAPLSTFEEYSLRLVFEWGWEQVKFSPNIQYIQEDPKPILTEKGTYKPIGKGFAKDGIIDAPLAQSAWEQVTKLAQSYPVAKKTPAHYSPGGYHTQNQHNHWDMADSFDTEAMQCLKLCKNLKNFHGIEVTVYQQSDPMQRWVSMDAAVGSQTLHLKKALDPYMGMLPTLQDMGQEMIVMIKKSQKDYYEQTALSVNAGLKKLSEAGYGSMKLKDLYKYVKGDDELDVLF